MPNTTKESGKMTLIFDQATYADLLTETVPQAIETEAEYERALATAEQLTFSQRTPEQTALYRLLVLLIEAYEAELTKLSTMPWKSQPPMKCFNILWKLAELVRLTW
jgi:hypothetical protein